MNLPSDAQVLAIQEAGAAWVTEFDLDGICKRVFAEKERADKAEKELEELKDCINWLVAKSKIE